MKRFIAEDIHRRLQANKQITHRVRSRFRIGLVVAIATTLVALGLIGGAGAITD